MSAIFGISGEVGAPFKLASLKNMSGALIHRGPDDYHYWQEKNVGLGHRMLRVTPEAGGEILPYHDPESGLVISSDARLDNRDELIDKLGRDNFKTEIIPDSQIILVAYDKWNTDCLQHIVGDFSFVIWDTRAQSLFCARDHLGVKPFYYLTQDNVFVFCSEAEVIAKYSGMDITLNEARLADSLTPHLEGLDKTSTCFQEVLRLPPGHFLKVTHGSILLEKYWEQQPSNEFKLQADGEYQEALTEILTRSVAARCRGIDTPAVLLSGGVDSAAILGLCRHLFNNHAVAKVQSFSGISEHRGDCKESQMIQKLIGSGGFTPHLLTPDSLHDLNDKIFPLIQRVQEPFDICMILIFLLYQQASQAGHKVVLDGVDGDMMTSLSSNYPRYLIKQGMLGTALRETSCQANEVYKAYTPCYRLFFRYLLSAWTPELLQKKYREFKSKSRVNGYLVESGMKPAFAKRAGLKQRLEQFERENSKNLGFPGGQYLGNVQHPFLAVGLERYDRVASLCAIEPRHPFINKRLVDFYLSVPWNQFARNGWPKFLLRKVAEQFIPSEVAWRTGNEHLGGEFIGKFLSLNSEKLKKNLIRDESVLNSFLDKRYFTAIKQKAPSVDVVGFALWLHNNRRLL